MTSVDIVEYAEKVIGVRLYDWQKKYLREIEKLPPQNNIRFVMDRGGRMYIYTIPTKKELIHNGKTTHSE